MPEARINVAIVIGDGVEGKLYWGKLSAKALTVRIIYIPPIGTEIGILLAKALTVYIIFPP
jgi:hypothetical protein